MESKPADLGCILDLTWRRLQPQKGRVNLCVENQPAPGLATGQRTKTGFERPDAGDWCEQGVVAQCHHMRYTNKRLAADGAVAVQLPNRLHVANVSDTLLGQPSGGTLGRGHSRAFATGRTAPKRIAAARNATVEICGGFESIVAIVTPIHNSANDLTPDGEPRGSIIYTERVGETSRVAEREIEAGQSRLTT